MNRTMFLERLFIMYKNTFSKENKEIWVKAYEAVLDNDIDYDRLFITMSKEYGSANTAPTPSWLLDHSTKIYKECEQVDMEKKIIKRINGFNYEFTIVPENWGKCSSEYEINKLIKDKMKG